MKIQNLTQPKTLGDWSSLAIEQHFQKTIKYEKDVLKDKDPESLHQMRVGMRRLRSAVTGFAPALDFPKAAEEEKIGKIARILGSLRDLDVLLEALDRHYLPTLPPNEQTELEKALPPLAKKRRKALKKVQATLKHKHYENLKKSVIQWLKVPTYQEIAQLPIQDVLPDLLLPQVIQLFLHPGWLVGIKTKKDKIDVDSSLNREAVEQELADRGPLLHSLRKQVKRVRYQMNLFTDFYSENYQRYVEDLEKIQEILGQMQDSEVVAEMLTEVLDVEIESALPVLAKQLAETRYKAWQLWQPLHKKYLNPETRLAFRSELLHPIPAIADKQAKILPPASATNLSGKG